MNSSIDSDIQRGHTQRLKTFALGGGFALLVLLILAWLQPVGVQEERAVAPQFRFKVAQKRAAKAPPRKPLKQEPKRREVKREEPKPQKKTLTRKAPQRRTTTPRKASSLRTGARSGFSGMNLMAGLGGAGAGGVSLPASQSFDAIAGEALELVNYQEQRRAIREMRDRGERDRNSASGTLSREARPVYLKKPNYPPKALQKQIGGFVRLRMLINRNGKIEEYEILSAQPEGLFEDAIEKVLGQWTFDAALDGNGKPIESWKEYNYVFKIEDAR